MTARLDQHIALVTGASGGIGRSISVALAMQGADVHLVGRNPDRLKLTADLCVPLKHQVGTTICELAEEQSIRRLGSEIAQRYGRLDILVHCAGAIGHSTLEDAPVEILDQQLAANIRGPLLLTQVMLPLLKKPRGQIVFINSSAGLSSAPGRGHFTATQHALRAIADTLRQEVNADSVRVLSVYPGRTATPRVEELFAKEKRPYQPEFSFAARGCRCGRRQCADASVDRRGNGHHHSAYAQSVLSIRNRGRLVLLLHSGARRGSLALNCLLELGAMLGWHVTSSICDTRVFWPRTTSSLPPRRNRPWRGRRCCWGRMPTTT